ncbi:hypothetical protein WDZ17_11200 [Pseudokineococcus basanitobsidens]|uniref:Lipoprotein n=1 Tax=Pseudokineococcus basanitobsidens TaxID=1926649 RepID=A0ABU8RLK3_9ACTN
MRSDRRHRPVGRTAAPLVALAAAGLLALTGCSTEEPLPSASDSLTPASPTSSPTTSAPSSVPPSSSSPTTAAPSPTPSASPTGVAVGGMVEGFPTDVVPVPEGAEVTLSNVVDAEGGGRTVALAGRTATSAEDLVAFYTGALAGRGFTATTPPAVEGAVVTTFTRDGAADLLTLSVTSTDGAQDFSIGGTLAP